MKTLLCFALFFLLCQAQFDLFSVLSNQIKSSNLSSTQQNNTLTCLNTIMNTKNILINSTNNLQSIEGTILLAINLIEHASTRIIPACETTYHNLNEYLKKNEIGKNITSNFKQTYPEMIQLVGLAISGKEYIREVEIRNYLNTIFLPQIFDLLIQGKEPSKEEIYNTTHKDVNFNLAKFYPEFFYGIFRQFKVENKILLESLSQCAISVTIIVNQSFTKESAKEEIDLLGAFSSCENAYNISMDYWKNNLSKRQIFKRYPFAFLFLNFPAHHSKIAKLPILMNQGHYRYMGDKVGKLLQETVGSILGGIEGYETV